jgi:hypothetical protein
MTRGFRSPDTDRERRTGARVARAVATARPVTHPPQSPEDLRSLEGAVSNAQLARQLSERRTIFGGGRATSSGETQQRGPSLAEILERWAREMRERERREAGLAS